MRVNFFYELGTCYPNNGKKFSDFPDCLLFLKLLNILPFRRMFSYKYVLEIYKPVAVNFLWHSHWCGMFWLNKDFITSCKSIKKHCRSVWGDVVKIQFFIACQISICIWFLEFSILLFLMQPTETNLQRKSDQIASVPHVVYAKYENYCYCSDFKLLIA